MRGFARMCHFYPWATPERVACLTEPQSYALASQIGHILQDEGEAGAAALLPLFATKAAAGAMPSRGA